MPSLRLSGLSFSYGGPPLLAGVSLHLRPGWTGVVGPNGAGKSTLIRLIAGELPPAAGAVARDLDGPVALCPQSVERLSEEIRAFADRWDRVALRWRGRLALGEAALERWPTLSPGERRRWQIAAALAADPGALLLDEPSNHLDGDARAQLLAALQGFRGVGVVVSHDRALLDALCSQTLWVEGGGVEVFPGGYSAARALREAALAGAASAAEALRAAQKKAARRVADLRRDQAAADHSRSAASRMKGPRDHDARGALAKGKAQMGEAAVGRQLAVARAAAERLAERSSALPVRPKLGRDVQIAGSVAPKEQLCRLQTPALTAGGRTLIADLDLVLRRRDRVHLSGPNGAGKTTLLRALLAEARLPPERLLWLPQDLAEVQADALLAEAKALPPEVLGAVMERVAALGVPPAALLATGRPSPGEARKLAIAGAMARGAWLLVLDEPTNHLDLPSVARLEAALADWPGALLLVSHDPDFAAAVTDTAWRIAAGRLEVGARGSGAAAQPAITAKRN